MNKLFTLLVAIIVLTGCENNDLLQSEDKIKGKLNGRWKLLAASSHDTRQNWKLENGSLTVTVKDDESDSIKTTDHGNYSVTSKFSRSYLTISSLSDSLIQPWDLNRQWTIAVLENDVLYISTTNESGAIISREFIKE